MLLHRLGDDGPAAHDGNAAQPLAPFDGVVVDEAADPALDVGAGGELIDQGLAGLTGADDHHVLLVGRVAVGLEMELDVAQHPPAEADGNGGDDAEDDANHIEGLGHQNAQHPGQHIADEGQQAVNLQNPQQLVGADEAPDAAVQPEEGEHRDADAAPGQDDLAIGRQKFRRDGLELEIEPEPQGGEEGDADAQQVHRADDERPFAQSQIKALSFIYHKQSTQISEYFYGPGP